MRAITAASLIACASCGRIGFDELDTAGDVDLVFADQTAGGTKLRRFQHASASWAAAVPATPPTGANVLWSAPRISPVDGSELIAVASASGELDVVRGPDLAFASTLSLTVLPTATIDKRGFDLAFERTSGTAVLVYSDGSTTPKYRRLAAGETSWSAEASVPSAGASSTSWVELVSRPGTDELALVFSDEAGELWALTQTAGTWDAAPTMLESLLRTTTWQAFAAGYESLSGDLLVVWGHSEVGAMGTAWTSKPAGQATFTLPATIDPVLDAAGPIDVEPDPASDHIAIGLEEYTCGGGGCDDAWAAMWDGTQLVTQSDDVDTEIGNEGTAVDPNEYGGRPGSRPVAISWLGSTGTAVFVWGCATSPGMCTSGDLAWALWQGSWSVPLEFAPSPAVGDKATIELLDLGDSLLAVFTDVDGDLWAKQFDGTAWHDTEGGAALATTGALAAQPFGADVR